MQTVEFNNISNLT